MLMSRFQNVGKKRVIKTVNRCFEDVAELKYLGTTLTDQQTNFIICTHPQISLGKSSQDE
jgi:hypothetical protein